MDGAVLSQVSAQKLNKEKKGISGSTIKIIAIVAMLIDHIGAIILGKILINNRLNSLNPTNIEEVLGFTAQYGTILMIYTIMRMIGRIGFPIFCFLLIEGFLHTKSRLKYALRLLAFAIISEIPFDLALSGKCFNWGYQNVFFTLFLGLLVMIACDSTDKLINPRINKFAEEKAALKVGLFQLLKIVMYIVAILLGIVASMHLQTDYGNPYGIGIICIMALYLFRKKKVSQIVAGCVIFIWEITAPLAFIPIGFYNGKRGLKMKYFFYAFYPVHLFILYLIARAMKLV